MLGRMEGSKEASKEARKEERKQGSKEARKQGRKEGKEGRKEGSKEARKEARMEARKQEGKEVSKEGRKQGGKEARKEGRKQTSKLRQHQWCTFLYQQNGQFRVDLGFTEEWPFYVFSSLVGQGFGAGALASFGQGLSTWYSDSFCWQDFSWKIHLFTSILS